MPKPIGWRQFVNKFKELGFNGPYAGGKHLFMVRDSFKIRIPNRHKGDISGALVKEILRQAGISNKEWE